MRIYNNGWYFIIGMLYRSKVNCHYFFKDLPLHQINSSYFGQVDVSKRRIIKESEQKRCKKCEVIIATYSHIGLENRLI